MNEHCTPAQRASCPHAEESAKLAVKEVFAILGVNVDIPKEVEEFRSDLRFGATLRRAADRGLLAVTAAIATAALAALWAGIVSKISSGGN